MKWALALLFLTGVAAQRRIDLTSAPWNTVMSALQRRADADAREALEHIGNDPSVVAWQRAHAFSWAGEIAERGQHWDVARQDYLRARDLDRDGFEGRMACVKLGRIAIRERRWFEAERWLSLVEHDPDPIIHAYAVADLRGVRERTRRTILRGGSIAVLALGLLAIAIRLIRRVRMPGTLPRFGRALLVTEALAIAGTPLVRRYWSPLATSSWMAVAVPFAIVAALLWSTRRSDAPLWRKSFVVIAFAIAMVAGIYVAADTLWWSAHAA